MVSNVKQAGDGGLLPSARGRFKPLFWGEPISLKTTATSERDLSDVFGGGLPVLSGFFDKNTVMLSEMMKD
jgi:hypothetical protein